MFKKKADEKDGFVDFAVTARTYKTKLTRKYEMRKPWANPSAYLIHSYIPGTILDILVQEGELVKEGEPLLILEAMKMRNQIEMPFTARVKKICVEVGQKIPKEYLLIELESAEEEQ